MKKAILSILILILAISVKAQNPFKRIPLPKPDYYITFNESINPDSGGNVVILKSYPDTAFNAFRFLINVSSYDLSNNALLTGFAGGWQHIKFDQSSDSYKEKWSANGVIWYKSRLNPSDTLESPLKYGIIGTFVNNLLTVGIAHPFAPFRTKNLSLTVGVSLSLN